MHEWINVAFHVRTKSGRYSENMECETNVALDRILDRKDELLERRNEIKIKHDNFSIFGEKCMWVRNSSRSGVPDFNSIFI